ncbi:MAG: hypothetical protein R3B70_24320 [Polyangiaceae bacterium]
MNTPALDDTFMYDGREPTLQSQAHGAIAMGHAQATVEPTDEQLDMIVEHEQSSRFFSSRPAHLRRRGPLSLPPGVHGLSEARPGSGSWTRRDPWR